MKPNLNQSWLSRVFLVLSIGLFLAVPAKAQTVTGDITTNSTTCPNTSSAACVVTSLNTGTNTVLISIKGTWTGTLTLEYSVDNQASWSTLADAIKLSDHSAITAGTTTANLDASAANVNFTHVRVRGSASMTGTASVIIRGTNNSAMTGVNFGAGGGTIGTVNQGTASATENWRFACISGCASAVTDNDDATIAAGQTGLNLDLGLTQVFDGTNWKRFTIGTAGTASTQVVTVQGIASMTPVLATLSGTNNINTVTAVTGITNALPAGTNVIGHVITDTNSTTAVTQATAGNLNATVVGTGTFAVQAAQSGTWNISGVAAAALADATSNPTTASFGALLMCYNGSTWDRCADRSIANDAAITIGTNKGTLVMYRASAAAPSDVSADNDAVHPWALRSGAGVFNPSYAGVLASTGIGVSDTGTPRVQIASGTFVSGAVTTAMTGTTSTSLVGGTASNYLYITSCQLSNGSTTVSTDELLQDGSGGTTLAVLPNPAATVATTGGGGGQFVFPTPLKVPTSGNALYIANVTTGSSTKASCQGYRSTVSQ